jgi:hypothetical protein
MDRYTELYAWIWEAFRREEFSIDQFRSTFPISQAPKVVHDLVKKGYLERTGRGMYKAVEPEEFIHGIADNETDYAFLEEAGKDYAFCESTAVSIWTDGYYWTGFTKGFRPVHVAVRERDLAFWKGFFRKKGVSHTSEGERRTLYGQVYVLHPRERLRFVRKNGLRIIPLEDVVSFCLERELAYEPALEYLDKKYGIGYSVRQALGT